MFSHDFDMLCLVLSLHLELSSKCSLRKWIMLLNTLYSVGFFVFRSSQALLVSKIDIFTSKFHSQFSEDSKFYMEPDEAIILCFAICHVMWLLFENKMGNKSLGNSHRNGAGVSILHLCIRKQWKWCSSGGSLDRWICMDGRQLLCFSLLEVSGEIFCFVT